VAGQHLRRPGPRPHRGRAATRPARQLPATRRPAGVRGGCDHLAALRRRVLTRARLLLPSPAPLGWPADHGRLGRLVDRPGQRRPRLLDRPGRRGAAAPLGRHRPASRSPGRPTGRGSGPATRYPAIKKPTKKPASNKPRSRGRPDRPQPAPPSRRRGQRPAEHACRVKSQAEVEAHGDAARRRCLSVGAAPAGRDNRLRDGHRHHPRTYVLEY
jgi:hypothetical protein